MTTLTSGLENTRDPGDGEASTASLAGTTTALFTTTTPSPIGTLTLVSDGEHLTGVYMENHTPAPRAQGGWQHDPRPFGEAIAQLRAYFAGDLGRFDLPLRFTGTSFQQTVWQALREIPFGGTLSYGELAKAIGQPNASRAVGLANGRNPLSIVVPCHRVIGSSGTLTGYAGGVERKRWLLRHEGVALREDAAMSQTRLI